MNNYKMQYIAFLGGCLAFQLIIQFILPYPFGLALALGLMITMPFIGKKLFLKKLSGFASDSGFGFSKMKMVCIACNLSSNKRICPRCGGRAFKTQ